MGARSSVDLRVRRTFLNEPCRQTLRHRSGHVLTHRFKRNFQTGFRCTVLPLLFLLAVCALTFSGSPARAHEVQPAIADLIILPDASGYQLDIALNLEVALAGVGSSYEDTDESPQAEEYDRLRALTPEQLRTKLQEAGQDFLSSISLSADNVMLDKSVESLTVPDVGDPSVGRVSRLLLSGDLPANAQSITFSWAPQFGAIVLRGPVSATGEGYTGYLQDGATSDPIYIRGQTAQSLWQVVSDYVVIGFVHIIPKGLDHILFVIGLFLLSTKFSPLLWQVTAFTLAHTITLALGMLGFVNIPSGIVEPLIAASIVYISVENLFMDHLSRWRPLVIFGFGLLHGLGFASVLTAIGLAPNYFFTGLISFNIGVELGQLSVILLCFLTVGIWFRNKPWYRPFIIVPGSLIIAAIGAFWFLERTILA